MSAFKRDLQFLFTRLREGVDKEIERKMIRIIDRLTWLKAKNMVKINHSVMELVCAQHLILGGYDVDVEHPYGDRLTCDVYGVKGYGTLIVEIETGFVPPEHALDPTHYCKTRIASKIARYSNYADKFAIGIPPHYVMQVPPTLTSPPRFRKPQELQAVKTLCDLYYTNPPVSLDEIRNARLHAVFVIDVDEVTVLEIDPEAYIEKALAFRY